MLLQELPKKQQKMKQLSPGYAIFLLILYWILNLVGQAIAIVPQMVENLVRESDNLTSINPNELVNELMKKLNYPWYINLFQALVFVFILWLFKRQNVQFFSTGFSKREIVQIVFYGVALVGISLVVEQVIGYFVQDFNTANQEALEGIFANSSRITMFMSIVILAPITEEVMFRGVFSLIFKKFQLLGFFVCAVAFTLSHMPNDLLSFLVYFIMALGLGAIYWKTKRIEASIFAHMLNNFIGFLLML